MPGVNNASQSSDKKQRSISSFFSQKAAPSSTPKAQTPTSEHYPGSLSTSNENGDTPTSGKRPFDDVGANRTPPSALPQRKKARLSDETGGEESQSHNGLPTQTSTRTSQYLFSSSPREPSPVDPPGGTGRSLLKLQRARVHEKFVQRLGNPDSISEIKRRRRSAAEDAVEEGDQDGEDDDEAEANGGKKSAAALKASKAKKAPRKLTPMEKQVLEIKRNHKDTLLIIEVGYKYQFFGKDASIAAKELGIVCIPGKMRYDEHVSEAHLNRFASASIPVHRLHVHVKRLVAAGHKVGVVRQLETAALKAAGDNKGGPFVRKLASVYTKGTYIDDVDDLETADSQPPATGYLLCIKETQVAGAGEGEKVQIGILAVQPATGDIIFDEFVDGFMRSETETRLLHIAPCEMLIVGELSKATEKLVGHLSDSTSNVFGDRIRVERILESELKGPQAHSHVASFYADKLKMTSDQGDVNGVNLLEKVLDLPERVTICLSAMIIHMKEYGLEHVFDLTKYFQSFSARSHMLLNGNTVASLEIYSNQTDYSEHGSLFWSLNRTKTPFGRRLLRKWVGRPLLDKAALEDRISAVEELKDGGLITEKLKDLLNKTKNDLEKGLLRIYYGRCSRAELLNVLLALRRVSLEFSLMKGPSDVGFESKLINNAIASLPVIADDVIEFLDKINAEAARNADKFNFFVDSEETESIKEHKLGIADVEDNLDLFRSVAASKIKRKRVDYITVAGIEYLIEIPNSQIKNIPASWIKVSGTKAVSRFHPPEIVKLSQAREQHKEALSAACDSAYQALLEQISTKYQTFRDCIQSLATLDCLLSLASVASQPGYVKPKYTEETCIEVEKGRHPMVEQILLDAYVPNDINLSKDETYALLITGPNMGGKSSFVRQVALIAIMGQIGSYVPAASAKLGLLDGVFTRMGAFDNIMAGESTFMVELSETSDILKQATPRSLVILDELGRGTSTHDGFAIAHAVLNHVVSELKCLTLFITHYQTLSSLAAAYGGCQLKNVHMRFREDEDESITFLYELAEGNAFRSYGLNVARLANLPEEVLKTAAARSKQLEAEVQAKKLASLGAGLSRVLGGHSSSLLESICIGIEQL